jgi:hypothetical protein
MPCVRRVRKVQVYTAPKQNQRQRAILPSITPGIVHAPMRYDGIRYGPIGEASVRSGAVHSVAL